MWKSPKLGLFVAALCAVSTWFYVQRVLIPYQEADAAAHQRPRGILSDLYPRWIGARALLLEHRDPYSDDVTLEIQRGYYGRPIDPARADDPKDEQRFAYPVYVVFVLAPTVKLPFSTVQSAFRWTLILLTGLSLLLWLRVVKWKVSCSTLAILLMLVLSSYPAIQGIKLQQLSLFVAGLIAVSGMLLVGGQLFLAGMLLALATIKPQLVFLLAFWLLLWSVSRWRERSSFVWGFLVTLGGLVAAAQYVLPGWFGEFVGALRAYNRYAGGHSLLDELAGGIVGRLLAVLAVLGTAVVCWRARRAPAASEAFYTVLALVLAITVLIVPMVAPYNQVLLIPALLLIARDWRLLWRKNATTRLVFVLAFLIVFWPWIASLGLMAGSTLVASATLQKLWTVPLWTSIAVPLAILPLLAPVIAKALKGSSSS